MCGLWTAERRLTGLVACLTSPPHGAQGEGGTAVLSGKGRGTGRKGDWWRRLEGTLLGLLLGLGAGLAFGQLT